MAELRARLLELPKNALADVLIEHGERDERLRERLLLLASTVGDEARAHDIDDIGRAIRRAISIEGFIDYRGADMYARQVEEALALIEQVLASPQRDEALRLVEIAAEALSSSMNNVDDSGELNDSLAHMRDLHLRACEAAKVTPQALAKRLFEAELHDPWCFFDDAQAHYALLLGEDGCTEFDRLIRQTWHALPMVGPHERSPRHDHRRARLTGMMQRLVGDDPEARIEIVKKDLSSPRGFERIAQLCIEAHQVDRAVTWIEKGLKLFSPRDVKLLALARQLYEQLNRVDDLVRLAFDDFVEQLDIASYRSLQDVCVPNIWPEWRRKARSLVEEQLAQGLKARARNRWPRLANGTLLVEMLLTDGDVRGASEVARRYGCEASVARRLASD